MLRSPPSRRRGLKFFQPAYIRLSVVSPPSRRRGLKLHWVGCSCNGSRVASFTEAWIEISSQMVWNLLFLASPPSWRHGLKSREGLYLYRKSRRLLRGGVDWNTEIFVLYRVILVASFTEAWIEISRKIWNHIEEHTSPPSRRRGLK